MNPVNCLLYCAETIDEACKISFDVPGNYIIATGLEKTDDFVFKASNYHELADCPIIASATLECKTIEIASTRFNLWFQGSFKLNWEKVLTDFAAFILAQKEMMLDFPFSEYHFLFQILPSRFYHGVEHQNSTVIALGPGSELEKPALYDELLGVSSHELFHAWNIKAIRPIELFPYNYQVENYSNLGYIAEGVTTYYGDVFLFRSNVFDENSFFKVFSEQFQRHFDNFGRFNQSVAEASFDTWLDGYEKGVPNRKVSIYTEGCLLAFICDVKIREATKNEKSLDDVMRTLYTDFAKKQKGYSETDYKHVLESVSGVSFDGVFDDIVWGKKSYESYLNDSLDYLGLTLLEIKSDKIYESVIGFKATESDGVITAIYPDSFADEAGLWYEDKIIAVDEVALSKMSSLSDLFLDCTEKSILKLLVERKGLIKAVDVKINPTAAFYKKYNVRKQETARNSQKENYALWRSNNENRSW